MHIIANKYKYIDTNRLEWHVRTYANLLPLWLVISIILPLYLISDDPMIVQFPDAWVRQFIEFIPTLNDLQADGASPAVILLANQYLISAVIALTSFVISQVNYYILALSDRTYRERVGGTLLDKGKKRFQRIFSISRLMFLILVTAIIPITMLIVASIHKIIPTYMIIIYLATFQVSGGILITFFVKRQWRTNS